jgi:hypothetical protein
MGFLEDPDRRALLFAIIVAVAGALAAAAMTRGM